MGSSSPRPSQTIATQVRNEYPEWYKPYLQEMLVGAQEQYEQPFNTFPESRLVDTPQRRLDVLSKLQTPDLAEMSQPGFEEGKSLIGQAGKTMPETDITSYLNPYQENVTNRLVEKARERRDIGKKKIGDAAARAGAFGGGRHGVERGLYEEGTEEEIGDIEAQGLMSNWQQATGLMGADKARQLQAGQQFAGLSDQQRKALTEGLVGAEKAATAEQAIGQQRRDVDFSEFQRQDQFDASQLADYSAILRGHQPIPNQWVDKTISTPYSSLQAGLGTAGALAGGLGKLFGKEGGAVNYNEGGVARHARGDVVEIVADKTDSAEDVVNTAIKRLLAGPQKKEERDQEIVVATAEESGTAKPFTKTINRLKEKEDLRNLDKRFPTDPQTQPVDIPYDAMRAQGQDGGLQGLLQQGASQQQPQPRQQPQPMGSSATSPPPVPFTPNPSSPVRAAYGGVPGQAYTEDIGMMGGLGAIAGPQMRFAYGGVPGQPYTEDIGMLGGLAAVAGPQMRFAEGDEVPEFSISDPSTYLPAIQRYLKDTKPVEARLELPPSDRVVMDGEAKLKLPDVDQLGIGPLHYDPETEFTGLSGLDRHRLETARVSEERQARAHKQLTGQVDPRIDKYMEENKSKVDALGIGPAVTEDDARSALGLGSDVQSLKEYRELGPNKEVKAEFPGQYEKELAEAAAEGEVEKGIHEFDQEDFDVGQSGIMPTPPTEVSETIIEEAGEEVKEPKWWEKLGKRIMDLAQDDRVFLLALAASSGFKDDLMKGIQTVSRMKSPAEIESALRTSKARQKQASVNVTQAQIKMMDSLAKRNLDTADYGLKVQKFAAEMDQKGLEHAREMLKIMADKVAPTYMMKIAKDIAKSPNASDPLKKLLRQYIPGKAGEQTKKAVGGTIPNSFKEAGITSLRRV